MRFSRKELPLACRAADAVSCLEDRTAVDALGFKATDALEGNDTCVLTHAVAMRRDDLRAQAC